MNSPICVDSGIILKLFLDEEDSHVAIALCQEWVTADSELIAPPLYPLELTAVFRKQVYQDKISADYGRDSLQQALELDVVILEYPKIHQHAWDLATQLNRPTAYDAHYLALAQHLDCEFWTADSRLYSAAHNHFPWIHWLGDFPLIDN